MRIRDLLLQRSTRERCGSVIVGDLVAATGRENLWSARSSSFDVIVIHSMSAGERFPTEPYRLDCVLPLFGEYGVSSHFLVSRRGAIYRLVPVKFKAWHCGGSIMPEPDSRCSVNDFSVGIELLATGISGFTDSQYQAVAALCVAIEAEAGKTMTYVGHDQIAGTRAVELGLRGDCKADPGPLFDWRRFFRGLDIHRVRAAGGLLI